MGQCKSWARPHVVTTPGGRPRRQPSQGPTANPGAKGRQRGRYQRRAGMSSRTNQARAWTLLTNIASEQCGGAHPSPAIISTDLVITCSAGMLWRHTLSPSQGVFR